MALVVLEGQFQRPQKTGIGFPMLLGALAPHAIKTRFRTHSEPLCIHNSLVLISVGRGSGNRFSTDVRHVPSMFLLGSTVGPLYPQIWNPHLEDSTENPWNESGRAFGHDWSFKIPLDMTKRLLVVFWGPIVSHPQIPPVSTCFSICRGSGNESPLNTKVQPVWGCRNGIIWELSGRHKAKT